MGLRNGILIRIRKKHNRIGNKFDFVEGVTGKYILEKYFTYSSRSVEDFTPVAGSILRTHISKRELKNGHISRFCSVFQVIQVLSSAKFFSAEEVDISFNSETKEHPQISNASFWKRDSENAFLQMF